MYQRFHIFLKVCYHMSFQDLKVSGATVTFALQVHMPAILLSQVIWIKNCSLLVSCSSIMYQVSWKSVNQFKSWNVDAHMHTHTHTHTHNLVIWNSYVSFPFWEGKYTKSKFMRAPKCLCVSVYVLHFNFWISWPIFTKMLCPSGHPSVILFNFVQPVMTSWTCKPVKQGTILASLWDHELIYDNRSVKIYGTLLRLCGSVTWQSCKNLACC